MTAIYYYTCICFLQQTSRTGLLICPLPKPAPFTNSSTSENSNTILSVTQAKTLGFFHIPQLSEILLPLQNSTIPPFAPCPLFIATHYGQSHIIPSWIVGLSLDTSPSFFLWPHYLCSCIFTRQIDALNICQIMSFFYSDSLLTCHLLWSEMTFPTKSICGSPNPCVLHWR